MCPDPELLSVYADHEVPSPWAEKLEAHLAGCPACAEKLRRYRSLSASLGADRAASDPALAAARERIRQKLEHAETRVITPRSWHRSVNLPLPVAAAAALALVVGTALLVRFPGATGSAMAATEAAKEAATRAALAAQAAQATLAEQAAVLSSPVQPAVPVNSMSDVLKYLDSQGSSAEIIILRLPEGNSLTTLGEPALLRETDYQGSAVRP